MTIDRNDPRWTAYVLDELNAEERALFENEMALDPDAAEVLAEARESVAILEAGLTFQEPVTLTSAQREEILASVPEAAAVARRSPLGRWSLAAGIAASLLVGVVTLRVIQDVPDRAGSGTFVTAIPTESVDQQDRQNRDRVPTTQDGESPDLPQTAVEVDVADPAATPPVVSADARPEVERQMGGQAGDGISGAIMDATGALIPGVEVTATARDGREVSVLTNESGQYRIAGLDSDDVVLKAELPGFATEFRELAPGDEERQDVVLNVAGTATNAEALASADARVREANASVGQTFAEPEAQAGPRGSRGIVDLLSSTTGAGTAVRDAIEMSSTLVAASPPPPPPGAPSVPGAFPDRGRTNFSTEEYNRITDNPFHLVSQEPLSTFSVDVDTASYANVRRFLNQRTLPPADAVRIEEMVNYFSYDYAPPQDGRPVRVHAEVAAAPWAREHRLVRIGIQGQEIERNERAASNLVFLIDVSGSMNEPDKLPLLVDGMKLLVDQLGENDRVAIAVYAGASGLVLDSTPGFRSGRILSALDRLRAGGSTNGGAGIRLAYDVAVRNFIDGGINRVILATDGDFNVGVTNNGDLTRLIEEEARTGVFLTVLGFGTGNYNDAGLEALADRGNGNYAYIDSIREARKVLVEEIGSTLVTIAKDVKFQVEFNPAEVSAYRLIGYENRALENQDFNNDAIDAGEIGAGHTVTALFEIVPAGADLDIPGVDPLRYQAPLARTDVSGSGELLTVKVRYKAPDGDDSRLIEAPVIEREQTFNRATSDFRFASAVAGFGMILRDSPYRGTATLDSILRIAENSRGSDEGEYRQEFVELVRRARALEDLGR